MRQRLAAAVIVGQADDVSLRRVSRASPRDGSLETFKAHLVCVQSQLREHVNEAGSWDDTSQLDVRVGRLTTWWRTGLLCIGDSAHAMSPIGGVGINLAVADGSHRIFIAVSTPTPVKSPAVAPRN